MTVVSVLAFACALGGVGYLIAMVRRDEPFYGMLAITALTVGAMFGAMHGAITGF